MALALGAILSLGVFSLTRIYAIKRQVTTAIALANLPNEPMQTAETTVTNTSGIQITVKTTRGKDESATDWMARHLEGVEAAKNS